MYEHDLKDMAKNLEEAGLLTPALESEMAVNRVVECMQKSWEDKIAIVWCVEDVKGMATVDSDRPTSLPADDDTDSWMTDEEAMEILRYMRRKHDAEVGINWAVIQHHVDELKYEKALLWMSEQEGKE
jgi:hypothetical protein